MYRIVKDADVSSQYAASLRFGPCQRPFRYGNGPAYLPHWLERLARGEGRFARLWLALVAHVANSEKETGRFRPRSHSWLRASGLRKADSVDLARAFLAAGGLEERGGELFVRDWAGEYRPSGVLTYLA